MESLPLHNTRLISRNWVPCFPRWDPVSGAGSLTVGVWLLGVGRGSGASWNAHRRTYRAGIPPISRSVVRLL
jgi:hypothetical protein